MSGGAFTYTSLPIGQIRLLGRSITCVKVDEQDRTDTPDPYRLATFPIEDCPAYEAIPYCWGNEAQSEACLLNAQDEHGGVLRITPHLKDGLRNAFAVLGSEWVWVDAICITQSDEEEKAEQVAQMGKIFADARRVVVWLGRDSEDSERVMRLMPTLASPEVLAILGAPGVVEWERLVSLGLPGVEDSFWVSLFDLLDRPWFERLWIIQEAVLGRNVVFLCGRQTVTWSRLKELCTALIDGDLIRELGQRSMPWRSETRSKSRNFRALGIIDNIKQVRLQRPWVAAMMLLSLIRKAKSNDPLDYVYGVLGLLPSSCRDRVNVDYSETSRKFYGRTYAQLFQALLLGMGDSALTFLNNIEKPPGAPSWCPELRSRTDPGYSSLRIPHVGAGCNPSKLGFQTPNAPVIGLESADTISMEGAVVDTVATIVPLVRPGKVWSYPLRYNDEEIVRTLMSFHQCSFATRQLNLSHAALARTLIGKATRTEKEEARLTAAFERTVVAFRQLSEHAVPLDASTLKPLLSDDEVLTYNKLLWSHWNGRSFFTTESECIGLGLRTMKPGDVVCIFFGAPKPYIMREDVIEREAAESGGGSEQRQSHKIIAECYVDGIMNGELFQQPDIEKAATTFLIN